MLSMSRVSVDLTLDRPLRADWIGTKDSIRERSGFQLDHINAVVGSGQDDFAAARNAVKRFDMARQGWMDAEPAEPRLELGTPIAVHAKSGPFWSVSIGRITGVEETPNRFALSYGTTKQHVAIGEERFDVVLRDNADVTFSITAISRPGRWWA
jgi:uncharacterized protein (UPF0548 family)